METLIIVCVLLAFVLIYILSVCFSEGTFPHKRKMEKMLKTISYYQKNRKLHDVECTCKDKTFKVDVRNVYVNNYFGYYEVFINNQFVYSLNILDHMYSKSRQECHCGDRRSYEVHAIIDAAYKHVKAKNSVSFYNEWSRTSYFN